MSGANNINAQAGPSGQATHKTAPKKKSGRNEKARMHHKSQASKAKLEAAATEDLDRRAMEYVVSNELSEFEELPISMNTKRGLKKSFFVKMTDIQTQSIPLALKGKDVLGSARTGSGKTLSFLVPILEMLYRKKWGPQDGLGALVISPTRELAVQIFEVLRSIGGYHSFSAGLVIGGKNLKDERDRLSRMNILVATPGRLLQHMDQTFGFECDNLQMLVLDEADRILDMGFARTLNALLSHLPRSRQTLLFSATQTDSVKDLARLSLKEPVFVGVKEEGSSTATPKSLEQHYVICELDKKLDILWSFIKSHLKSKALIFLSSGKQVRFVFETFCKLHPGTPLLHLHGKQKQTTRLTTFNRFTSMKNAIMFATDIAARGLDFPSVDWVVQVDAPEDAETYIHRVGRTARYESHGKGLLLLCPSEEEGMLSALRKKEISIEKIKIKGSKTQSIEQHLQNLAFQEPEIKYLGQRAFVSYMRSVYLQKDKSIFKLDELPAERFAASLGLPGAPKIKFMAKDAAKKQKNASHTEAAALNAVRPGNGQVAGSSEESSVESEADRPKETKKNAVRTKYDRMFERKNQNILSEHYKKLVEHDDDSDADSDDFITLKRADHELAGQLPVSDTVSKRKQKMGQSKKAMLKFKSLGEKLLFDDEGRPHQVYEMRNVEEEFRDRDVLEAAKVFAEGERSKLREADVQDKEVAREKRKEKKRKRKERELETAGESQGLSVEFAGNNIEDGYVSPEFDLPSHDEDSDSPPTKKVKGRNEEEDLEAMASQLLHR